MNPFELLSTLTGSFLAFFSAAVIVEALSLIIKNPRTRANLRLLPFVSMAFDMVFSTIGLGNYLNPLNCHSCVQYFILQTFFPDLKLYLASNQLSLVNYLATHHQYFYVFVLAFFIISCCFVTHSAFQLISVARSLLTTIKKSVACLRPINNFHLAFQLQKKKVHILVNNDIKVPCAAYGNVILMPGSILKELSQSEFEAVISHEMAHLRWCDPYVRLVLYCISAMFWWIPMKSWIQKLEDDQEIACDNMVVVEGLERQSLATALVKVAHQSKSVHQEALCYLAKAREGSPLRRLRLILGFSPRHSASILMWSVISLVSGTLFLLVCMN